MKQTKLFKRILSLALGIALIFNLTLPALAISSSNESDSQPILFDSSDLKLQGQYVQNDDGSVRFEYTDPSVLKSQRSAKPRAATPAKYDLRNVGGKSLVTPVRNQGAYGACWTFGTLASLESNMLVKGNASASSLDLAERHLAYYTFDGKNLDTDKSLFAGNDSFLFDTSKGNVYQRGGNDYLTKATLARRYGVADEKDSPYKIAAGEMTNGDKAGGVSQTLSRAQVKDVIFYPLPTIHTKTASAKPEERINVTLDTEAMNEIKQGIIKNGATAVSYRVADPDSGDLARDQYYNAPTHAYYYDIDSSPNHEVSIIGWDDDYAVSNFVEGHRPPNKGAWIVKNSWGDDWGKVGNNEDGMAGYFYLSYYDKTIADVVSYIADDVAYDSSKDVTNNSTYKNIYQYDGVSFGDSTYAVSQPFYGANFFTARSDETISALGVSLLEADLKVNLEVYLNPTKAEDPTSGTLKYSYNGIISKNAGYYVHDMGAEAFDIAKGDTFAVVISLENSDGDFVIPFEMSQIENFVSLECEPGQTSLGVFNDELGKDEWGDITDNQIDGINFLGNAFVKAYSNPCPTPVLDKLNVTFYDFKNTQVGSAAKAFAPVGTNITVTPDPYTFTLSMSPVCTNGGTAVIKKGNTTYAPTDKIPASVFINTTPLTVTLSSKFGDVVEEYTVVPNPLTTTELTSNGIKLRDHNGFIPQNTTFTSQALASGDVFDKVATALTPMAGDQSFTLRQITTTHGGSNLSLADKQVVSLTFPLETYKKDMTELYTVKIENGVAVLTRLEGAKGDYSISYNTAEINAYYVVAQTKLTPTIPTTNAITYSPLTTLADITLNGGDTGGTWAWKDATICPTSSNNPTGNTYTAIFTPDASSDYYKMEAQIPVVVNKAVPVLTNVKADSYTYGTKLSEKTPTGDAKLGANVVAGSFSWETPTVYPTVSNTGYTAVFTPDDEVNYESVKTTIIPTVSAKKITVTANETNYVYGDTSLPTLDFTLPQGALVGDDTKASLGLTLTSTATGQTAAGTYLDITKSAATNSNYDITVDGTRKLLVTKKALSLDIDHVSITYGDAIPTSFTYKLSGLVNGDTESSVNFSLSTNATSTSLAGVYDITPTIRSTNYSLPAVKGKLIINPIVFNKGNGKLDNWSSLVKDLISRFSISGSFTATADGKLVITDLTKSSDGKTVFTSATKTNETLALQFDASFTGVTGLNGPLKLALPVGDVPANTTVNILHYVKKGELDKNGNAVTIDTIDVYENVTIIEKSALITVYSLSPFAVVYVGAPTPPTPPVNPDTNTPPTTPDEKNPFNPITADPANPWTTLVMSIVAGGALTLLFVLKRRMRKSI